MEAGARCAFRVHFPHAVLHICYFHFGQALDRKLGNYGLKTVYEDVPEFRKAIHRLKSLAFLKPAEVLTAYFNFRSIFKALIDQLLTQEFVSNAQRDQAIAFMDRYFQPTYVAKQVYFNIF